MSFDPGGFYSAEMIAIGIVLFGFAVVGAVLAARALPPLIEAIVSLLSSLSR